MNTIESDVVRLGPNYGMVKMQPSTSCHQTILLVDDEENILKSLSRLLRPLKCHVAIALSAKQALLDIVELKPDLIISDVRMPGMDGIEFLSIVARDYPEIERILLTGYADIDATIGAINSGGVSYYVQKPWDDQALRTLVEKTLIMIDLRQHNLQLQETIKNQNAQLKEFNQSLEKKVKKTSAEFIDVSRLLKERSNELKYGYHNFVELFTGLLAARMGEAFKDDEQTSRLAVNIGKKLYVADNQLIALHFATKLRHIGMLGFSDDIITMPYELMDSETRKVFHEYPLLSHAFLSAQPALLQSSNIILEHKERLNGSGYPKQLTADKISLPAKILAVVNDFTALRKGLLVKQTLTVDEALTYLAKRHDTEYDSDVVTALTSILQKDNTFSEALLPSTELCETMALSENLINKAGTLLLAKGTVLDNALITKIKELEQRTDEPLMLQVYV